MSHAWAAGGWKTGGEPCEGDFFPDTLSHTYLQRSFVPLHVKMCPCLFLQCCSLLGRAGMGPAHNSLVAGLEGPEADNTTMEILLHKATEIINTE